jgi:hypothetical protein
VSRDRLDTPVELPTPVVPEHREMIRELADAGMQLTSAVQLLGDIVHELRVARDPIGNATREKIGRFGLAVREVGAGIVGAFAPQFAKETP